MTAFISEAWLTKWQCVGLRLAYRLLGIQYQRWRVRNAYQEGDKPGNLQFWVDGTHVGIIELKDGRVEFTGSADDAAVALFGCVKHMADWYIETSLARQKKVAT